MQISQHPGYAEVPSWQPLQLLSQIVARGQFDRANPSQGEDRVRQLDIVGCLLARLWGGVVGCQPRN